MKITLIRRGQCKSHDVRHHTNVLPTFSLIVGEYVQLRVTAAAQIVPGWSSPHAIHLSCNSSGDIWIVTRHCRVPLEERLYVDGCCTAVDALARLLVEEFDPLGGRFCLDLDRAFRTDGQIPMADIALVA